MRDNTDTSPDIIKIRKGGNVARLNIEIALSNNQSVSSGGSSNSATSSVSSIVGQEISTGTGGFVPPTRCFTGDTLIKSVTLFPIREAREGDLVLGFDENRKRSLCRITDVLIHETTSYLKIKLQRGSLNITPEHMVYDGEGFKPIRDFRKGDFLLTSRFNKRKILSIDEIVLSEPILVYNIETESHTYFANGFAVHNAKTPLDEL